jgi:hypothetical protein
MYPLSNDDQMQRRALLSQMGGDRNQMRNTAAGPTEPALSPSPLPASPSSPVPSTAGAAQEPAATSIATSATTANPYKPLGSVMQIGAVNGDKWADPEHIKKSPKYAFLKAAEGLGMKDTGEILRRFKEEGAKYDPSGFFKNARFGGSKGDRLIVDGDLPDAFKGMREFDVIKAAGEGGRGWQWGDPYAKSPGKGASPMPGGNGGSAATGALSTLTDPGAYQRFMQMIQGITGAEGQDRNALLALLQQ